MKRTFLCTLLFSCAATLLAQPPQGANPGGNPPTAGARGSLIGERKFQILVSNEHDTHVIERSNQDLADLHNRQPDGTRGVFSDLLKLSFGNSFRDKTVGATRGVIGTTIDYIAQAIRGNSERWHSRALQQCTFTRKLSTETIINDFYALPSTKGAMDPENLRFQGFGCKNYIEVKEQPGRGREVFYIFCKMRRDSIGLQRILNHSKFIVEVDSFMFDPVFCGLPNDSSGSLESRFDFDKRDNLNLTIKVRLYSSWINEAIQVTNDQQLGEFTIRANISKEMLNEDGVFVYDSTNIAHRNLVSVEGDCFIVPRSFTGTCDANNYERAWGTGQYRVEMDILENCTINDNYYRLPSKKGNRRNRRWDKNKWKPEWDRMRHGRETGYFGQVWQSIITAYRGTSWVTTLTDPFTTALYQYETSKLNDWLDLNGTQMQGGSQAGKQSSSAMYQGGGATSQGGTTAPTGQGSGKPQGTQSGPPAK